MKDSKTLVFLGIGDAGVYGRGKTRRDAYSSTTSSVSIPDSRLERYYHRLDEGCVVLDKRAAFARDAGAAVDEVVRGPMLDVDAPPDQVDDGSGWGRSLQRVGLDVYLATWRGLGARVGRRKGKAIVWEDGTVEPIDWSIQD